MHAPDLYPAVEVSIGVHNPPPEVDRIRLADRVVTALLSDAEYQAALAFATQHFAGLDVLCAIIDRRVREQLAVTSAGLA